MFGQVPAGLAVFGADRRLQRFNPTWAGFVEDAFGVPAPTVRAGQHFFELFLEQEPALGADIDRVLAGEVVRRQSLRLVKGELVTHWDLAFVPTSVAGRVAGFMEVVTDATERVRAYETLEARIAAFAAVADATTLDRPLDDTLHEVARSVRAATGSRAAAAIVWPDDRLDRVIAFGDDGLPPGYRAGLEASYAGGARSLLRVITTDGVVSVVPGFRVAVLADPQFAPLAATMGSLDADDAVVVRLGMRGTDIGCLLLYVAAGRRVTDEEQLFLEAVGNQVAVAVENAHLFGRVQAQATLVERQRLARELHDSVSQSLFSMNLHARTAQRQLAGLDLPADAPVAASVATVADLAHTSLAEMRALIFELRPGALEEEGLVAALRRQVAALASRERRDIAVDAPSTRLPLDAVAEEHLYRLTLEALHNSVKHAGATAIRVAIELGPGSGTAGPTGSTLRVRVADDGRGFDPAAVPPGHLGQTTMRDRARAVGGELEVDSAPGRGTTVTVTVPLAVPAG